MATTQNTYTGNGSTVLYSFTFPYLATTDIKVSVNGTNTTAYTLANATTIQFTAAPANGAAIRIYRTTDDSQTKATFFPGSSIRAQSLNDNFTQNLYVTQEASNVAATSATTSTTALTQSATAISTANTASANASAAVTTSNAASATAASAVTTANSAVTTANTKGDAAIASAAAANVTANSAVVTANNAVAAVSAALIFTNVSNVSSIPSSPANNTAVQVVNSTGIQSFSPLTGLPAGFVGNSGLWVRIRYDSAASTWVYVEYNANDPENRYLSQTGGTLTGALTLSGAPSSSLQAATKAYVDAGDATLTTSVGTAQTTANTAVTNAAAAQSTANTGVTNAANAQTTANTGVANAATAQSTANTAVSNAAAAQSTANTAVTNAATAQTTANAALPKAGGTMSGNITFNGGQSFPNTVVLSGTNGSAVVPNGTTGQRDASPATGYFRYNTTLSQFEGYNGTAWGGVGGGATGSGTDRWAVEHDNTITQSYSITAGKNVISAGSMTINNGVTVTVPSGSSWSIV